MDDMAFFITASDPRRMQGKISALWCGLSENLASYGLALNTGKGKTEVILNLRGKGTTEAVEAIKETPSGRVIQDVKMWSSGWSRCSRTSGSSLREQSPSAWNLRIESEVSLSGTCHWRTESSRMAESLLFHISVLRSRIVASTAAMPASTSGCGSCPGPEKNLGQASRAR